VFGILKKVITSKTREFVVSIILVLSVVIFFGMFMYVAERKADPDNFGSIPRTMYFVMVTLSTIGYGDVVPKTLLGKFIVTVGALLPLAVFGIPLSVIASGLIEELQKDTVKLHEALKNDINSTKKKTIKERFGLKSKKKENQELEKIKTDEDELLKNRGILNHDIPKVNSSDSIDTNNSKYHRHSMSFGEELEDFLPFDVETRMAADYLEKRLLLKFINNEEDIVYDNATIQVMLKNNISMKGIFHPNPPNILKMKKLNGLTSVSQLIKALDQEPKIKEVHRFIQSIDRVMEMWKNNELSEEDSKILTREYVFHRNSLFSIKNKSQIKENIKYIAKEACENLFHNKLTKKLKFLINVEVKKRITDSVDLFEDLKKITTDVIECILEKWITEELDLNDDIQQMLETLVVKNISSLPSWIERKEKLKKLIES
jgi:hypothetical protein